MGLIRAFSDATRNLYYVQKVAAFLGVDEQLNEFIEKTRDVIQGCKEGVVEGVTVMADTITTEQSLGSTDADSLKAGMKAATESVTETIQDSTQSMVDVAQSTVEDAVAKENKTSEQASKADEAFGNMLSIDSSDNQYT